VEARALGSAVAGGRGIGVRVGVFWIFGSGCVARGEAARDRDLE